MKDYISTGSYTAFKYDPYFYEESKLANFSVRDDACHREIVKILNYLDKHNIQRKEKGISPMVRGQKISYIYNSNQELKNKELVYVFDIVKEKVPFDFNDYFLEDVNKFTKKDLAFIKNLRPYIQKNKNTTKGPTKIFGILTTVVDGKRIGTIFNYLSSLNDITFPFYKNYDSGLYCGLNKEYDDINIDTLKAIQEVTNIPLEHKSKVSRVNVWAEQTSPAYKK